MDGLPPLGRAPRVTVLTTTHNGARLIGRTIDSILGQTFGDFELLVVDDGSTDDTLAVLAEYRDPRLRLVRTPQTLGVVGSRNFGFALARGALVAALDHDDLSLPTRLARQVAYLGAHPEVVLVGSDDWLLDDSSTDGGRMRAANASFVTDPEFMRWLLLLRNPIAYSSVMVRADAVRRLGVFMREARVYADDFDLYHRLLAVGEVGRVDARLTVYRLHAANTFRAREAQMIANAGCVLRDAYAGLLEPAVVDGAVLLVTRLLFARALGGAADLAALAEVLDRLAAGYARERGLDAAGRERVGRHVDRVLSEVAVRHVQAGRLASVRSLLRRPAVWRALARSPNLVLRAAMIGALPGKAGLRRLRDRLAAPPPASPRPISFAGQVFRPVPLERDRPPTLLVVVDTEAEFDWSKPFSPDLTQVTAIAAQAGMQAEFDERGLRPVYVVDYPVATQVEAYAPLRAILERGGCEIGAHHHPWTTPPVEEAPTPANSYPCSLPPALEARKLATLVVAIRQNFGIDPVFYKAGRYGLGAATPGLLAAHGIRVDFSVLPGADLRARGGPDFSRFAPVPYEIDGMGVLSLPMSRAALGVFSRVGPGVLDNPALRASRLGAVLSRARLLEAVTLTPEGVTAAEQIRLIEALLRRGRRLFVLHYHSPSLMPGHTPYVRTAADAREFRDRVAAVLAHFLDRVGGLPGNPRDLLPAAMRGHGGRVGARADGGRREHCRSLSTQRRRGRVSVDGCCDRAEVIAKVASRALISVRLAWSSR